MASVFTNFLECVQRLRDSAVNTQSNGENNEKRGCNDVNSLVCELGCCKCKVSLVRSSQGSGLITTFTVDIED